MFFLGWGYGKLSRNPGFSVFFGFWASELSTNNNVCIVNLMWSEDGDVFFGEEDGTSEGFLDDEG